MEAPAESDDRLSTSRRRNSRSRAQERRKRQLRRRRILIGSMLLAVVLIAGVFFAGIRGILKTKEKTELLETGITYMDQGNYEAAITAFEQELETAGGHIGSFEEEVLLYRAEAEYLLGDYAAALHTWQILLEEDKKNPLYQKCVAIGLMETGDFQGALAMDVINARVYNHMAKAQIEAGQYEEALTSVSLGLMELAEDSQVREEGKEGRYTAEEAVSIRRNLAFHEAVAFEYQGNFAKALQLFEAYVDTYGPDETAEREITFLQTRQGNY